MPGGREAEWGSGREREKERERKEGERERGTTSQHACFSYEIQKMS